MKNAIKYYYNIDINEFHQYNQEFRFNNANNQYILFPYNGIDIELEEKYKLQLYINSIGINCHTIKKNNNGKLFTIINNKKYVLIQIQTETRPITINDIITFTNININAEYFNYINRSEWYKMWKIKVDYIEYQITQFGKKYPAIRESIDYYIGISETCISLLTNIKKSKTPQSCMHNRISEKTTTIEFFNPLNFIIDQRIRDFGEYLTSKLYEQQDIILLIDTYIKKNTFSQEEVILLFIRIMYPSNYFDICEEIIEKKSSEEKLKELIEKINIFEINLKKIYQHIKKYTLAPEIEWLKDVSQY